LQAFNRLYVLTTDSSIWYTIATGFCFGKGENPIYYYFTKKGSAGVLLAQDNRNGCPIENSKTFMKLA
jgi:hypothetical protein